MQVFANMQQKKLLKSLKKIQGKRTENVLLSTDKYALNIQDMLIQWNFPDSNHQNPEKKLKSH